MGRSQPLSSAADRELQQMWRSLLRGGWSSIAVVPTDPGTSARPVTAALAEVASREDVGPLRIIDAQGATVASGERLAQDLAAAVVSGTRAVAAVDSLMRSLGGVPLVRDAEAALLVVRLGASDFDSVQSTLEIVGRGRILGTVALPPDP